MSLRVLLKFWLILLCFCVSQFVHAQGGGSAVMRGTVTDPDSAVIPGATVTLTPAQGKGDRGGLRF